MIDWPVQEGSRELESELEAQLTQAEIKNKVINPFINLTTFIFYRSGSWPPQDPTMQYSTETKTPTLLEIFL